MFGNLDKMKGSFLILLILLIFSATILAEELEELGNFIGLEEIVGLALEKNLDLKLAVLNLEDARIEYKKAQLNNLLNNSRLLELQSELSMVQAEENYKDIKNDVVLDIISKYLELISISQQIVTTEKEVYLEEKRVEEVEAQVEVGYKSSLDLFEQETFHLLAVNSLEKLKGDLDQEIREIKQKISLDTESNILLTDLVKPEIWTVSKEDMSLAVLSSAVVDIQAKQLEVAKNDLQKARISGIADLDLKKKELALERAELELKKEKQNIQNNINNAYFQYEQMAKNMNMAEKSLIQAEEHYKIILEQNEAGIISNNDLLSSELSLYKAKDEFINSISNYYIAVLKLRQEMGMELEVSISNE